MLFEQSHRQPLYYIEVSLYIPFTSKNTLHKLVMMTLTVEAAVHSCGQKVVVVWLST